MSVSIVQVRVRFNAEEAVTELLRLQLIQHSEGEDHEAQHYTALSAAEASDHLTVHWKELLQQQIDDRIHYVE